MSREARPSGLAGHFLVSRSSSQPELVTPRPDDPFDVIQILAAVKLDRDAQLLAEQIDFHSFPSIKGNGKIGVQAKPAGGLWQSRQTAV